MLWKYSYLIRFDQKKKNIIIEFNELWKWYIIQIRRIDIIIYISIYNINLKITLRDHKTVLVMEIKNL